MLFAVARIQDYSGPLFGCSVSAKRFCAKFGTPSESDHHAVRSDRQMPHDTSPCLSNEVGPYVLLHQTVIYLIPLADGVTMLPTFMPVATQAAIKGLTPQQVEALGVTLILNNTYHLNLRPGMKVLNEAGGAHKFQGWQRNLLTVSRIRCQ